MTVSGLNYARRLQGWKRAGYRVEIVYLRLWSIQLALRRIAARVRQGSHDVPRRDVVRRLAGERACLLAGRTQTADVSST
jgi:predicted ABC-type ATPase